MRVAAVQHDIVWEDRDANYARLAPMIEAAAAAGARLVALTEMFATGFSMDASRIAEPRDGPSSQFLREQARSHDVWICGSIAEGAPAVDRPFNTLVLAGPDGTLQRYDKIHPFTYAGEHEHYSAGTELVTVAVEGVAVSPFVCYDLRLPTSCGRSRRAPTSTSSSPTGPRAVACTGRCCYGRARSRTRPTSSASTASAPRDGSRTRATRA